MRMHGLVLTAIVSVLALAPHATAQPPSDYTCPVGYNPTAFSNVCVQGTPGSPPGNYNPGGVGLGSGPSVCIIGDLCESVPVPVLTPTGPVNVPIPGTPGHPGPGLYVEVKGVQVDPATTANCHYDATDSGACTTEALLDAFVPNGGHDFDVIYMRAGEVQDCRHETPLTQEVLCIVEGS